MDREICTERTGRGLPYPSFYSISSHLRMVAPRSDLPCRSEHVPAYAYHLRQSPALEVSGILPVASGGRPISSDEFIVDRGYDRPNHGVESPYPWESEPCMIRPAHSSPDRPKNQSPNRKASSPPSIPLIPREYRVGCQPRRSVDPETLFISGSTDLHAPTRWTEPEGGSLHATGLGSFHPFSWVSTRSGS